MFKFYSYCVGEIFWNRGMIAQKMLKYASRKFMYLHIDGGMMS